MIVSNIGKGLIAYVCESVTCTLLLEIKVSDLNEWVFQNTLFSRECCYLSVQCDI